MVSKEFNAGPAVGRRERKRLETQERLFGAALELFARQGFEATRVEEITEAADVAKGTFFNYFPSKYHLLMHLVGRQLEKMDRAIAEARQIEKPIHHILRAMGRELAATPAQSPELMRSVLAVFLGNDDVRATLHGEIAVRVRGKLAELMELGQQRGEIRPDLKPMEIARTFQQSMFGTFLLWSLHPQEPLAGIIDCTQGMLWSGLRAGGRAPKAGSAAKDESRGVTKSRRKP